MFFAVNTGSQTNSYGLFYIIFSAKADFIAISWFLLNNQVATLASNSTRMLIRI
jgi:hypothetical protein